MSAVVAGIFVGGKATRMGGRRKELLLTSSGRTIEARWRELFAELSIPVVMVGTELADEGTNAGPLGGLAALLAHAGDRRAISVAGDMPFVSRALLERLIAAPRATVVAPRRDGRWEPFLAIWDATRALPILRARIASRELALHGALDALAATELVLTETESAELVDWDAPEDVER